MNKIDFSLFDGEREVHIKNLVPFDVGGEPLSLVSFDFSPCGSSAIRLPDYDKQ